ncbi:MAG: DUF502 domain-containing protein [Cypionkella sp.]|nr:DUF502 domain-containing protein [Cypionkella sp.]
MTDSSPPKRSLFAAVRGAFFTGLVVVLPVGLTIYVVWGVIGWIDGWILPLIPTAYQPEELVHRFFGPEAEFPVRGVGVLVFLVVTAAVGAVARGLIGRSIIRRAEGLVDRLPIVRSVYSGVKQVTETFFTKAEKNFDRTCLVRFPHQGAWSVGLVASAPQGEIAAKLPGPDKMIAVFVALTPMTSGMLIYVPARDVILLDMKADEAIKLVVSAGLVYPAQKPTL